MAFQFRRDTAANWATANPVLAPGEPAYELDTRVLKIGDGLETYNRLAPYSSGDNATAGGRLSVIQNVSAPDPWATLTWNTSAAVVWYVPHSSDKITLWSGTNWQQYTFNNTTMIGIGGLPASKNFDIFAYQVNGVVTLSAVQWTNNTTRAVSLVSLNGVLVRSGMATMRYIGTIRTNTTAGTTSDLLGRRLVYNYYNQLERPLAVGLPSPHTYSTSAWRIWNNSVGSGNCLQLVLGVRQPIPVFAQSFVRYGYFHTRIMAGTPYTTTISAPPTGSTNVNVAGGNQLALSVVDDNVVPNFTTVSGANMPSEPRPVITAVSGNVVTLSAPLTANVNTLDSVILGPAAHTIEPGGNAIAPTALSGQASATVVSSGIAAGLTLGGFCSLVPCEYGISADSYFTSGRLTALPMM
jgi:hypothetical protein